MHDDHVLPWTQLSLPRKCLQGVLAAPGYQARCGSLATHPYNEMRDDDREASLCGRRWCDLSPEDLPPCVAKRGAFLAPFDLERWVHHPYAKWSPIFSHFDATPLYQPAYSAACIPFRWMRSDQAARIAEDLHLPFSQEAEKEINEHLGFAGGWVQAKDNQAMLLDTFFSAVRPRDSLCFFCAKHTPLSETTQPVLVAVGRVTETGPAVEYRYKGPGSHRAMVWERTVRHSVRPRADDGFVLPYHQILEAAARDPNVVPEDFIVPVPEEARSEFSYACEHVSHDKAISVLLACQRVLHRVSSLIPGPWDQAISWIDRELNRLWHMRGPCPGFGSALSVFGFPNATLLAHEIAALQRKEPGRWGEDPWTVWDALMDRPDLLGPSWVPDPVLVAKRKGLRPERRSLLKLLSRIVMSADQATRFYQRTERSKAGIRIEDLEILENPYLIYELDRFCPDPIPLHTHTPRPKADPFRPRRLPPSQALLIALLLGNGSTPDEPLRIPFRGRDPPGRGRQQGKIPRTAPCPGGPGPPHPAGRPGPFQIGSDHCRPALQQEYPLPVRIALDGYLRKGALPGFHHRGCRDGPRNLLGAPGNAG